VIQQKFSLCRSVRPIYPKDFSVHFVNIAFLFYLNKNSSSGSCNTFTT
jgi:hypothetical protein